MPPPTDETTDEGPEVNIRSLTRGDGVVIGAAVLLFIASFLEALLRSRALDSADHQPPGTASVPAWGSTWAGVIGAALVVVNRSLPQPRKVAGLDLGTVRRRPSPFSPRGALFWPAGGRSTSLGSASRRRRHRRSSVSSRPSSSPRRAVATPLVPALKVALVGAPKPAAPQPYGGQPQGGYGYPGAQQQDSPASPTGRSRRSTASRTAASRGGQQGGQPQSLGRARSRSSPGGRTSRRSGSPCRCARPLFSEDGSQSPIAELAPGTWYLAVEQRGRRPGRADAGRPARRPAGHVGHPARLTRPALAPAPRPSRRGAGAVQSPPGPELTYRQNATGGRMRLGLVVGTGDVAPPRTMWRRPGRLSGSATARADRRVLGLGRVHPAHLDRRADLDDQVGTAVAQMAARSPTTTAVHALDWPSPAAG